MKYSIVIYLQHYLAPSMTFIYRQLKSAEASFDPIVFCSDKIENQRLFPYYQIFFKARNFLKIKKSYIFEKFYSIHKLLSISPKLSYQQKFFFSNIIKNRKVKLIHAHFGPSGLEIVDIAENLKIPLIVTFHGYDASFLLRINEYKNNIQKVFNYANIIAVSSKMKTDLMNAGANEKQISVIRCGIPIAEFSFTQREPVSEKIFKNKKIIFLQISNFVEKKGHKFTIEAFKNFVINIPNAELILAGEGYLRNSMQRLCEEYNIANKVKFLGLVNSKQVSKLMKEADIFLHHSITSSNGDMEGIPTVIMEAMATGLPVISTNHAGIPELITNNVSGYLVDERDVEAYTNTLMGLSNFSGNISINAHKKVVNDFNLQTESKKLFDLYNSILKSN